MSLESKTDKTAIEETVASFIFCSLQNQTGLNFLHLDDEGSLRVCIVNAGPSSFQTITTAEPNQRARIVIDFSNAGARVRFTAPPDPVPGFDVVVDESGPVITLVQTAYYWNWFAGEYLAVHLPGVIVEGENGSGEVSVTLSNLEGGVNQSFSAVLMRLKKTGAASTTRANWRHGNTVSSEGGGTTGLTKDSNSVLKLTLTNDSGFIIPKDNKGNYPSFYVMLADGYQPGFSSLMPPSDAKAIEATTSDDSSWEVSDIGTSGFPVWKLTPNKLRTGDSNYVELKLSNIISSSSDRGDVIVYHLGIMDQVDTYQVMQVMAAAPAAEGSPSVQILNFTVNKETLNNINSPTEVLLSWNVQNAGFVTLTGFGVVHPVVTNQATMVEQTTTFVLTAFSASLAEAVSKNVTVKVFPSIASRIVPQKTIMLWSGKLDTIPAGWVICDGNNGTPNLTDRFVMGAGRTAPNEKGDATTHAHNVPQLSNTFSTASAGSHSHKMPSAWYARGLSNGRYSGIDANNDISPNTRTQSDGDHAHSVGVTFPAFLSGSNNQTYRPAWYALYFIMKTGI